MKKLFLITFIILSYNICADDFSVRLDKDGKGVIILKYTGSARDVTIPTSIEGYPVTAIYEDAFVETNITSVVWPRTITHIAAGMFNGTPLRKITLPNTLVRIERGAFSNTQLTEIILPASIEFINDGAFRYCKSLTSIIIPDSVESIKTLNMSDIYGRRFDPFADIPNLNVSTQARIRKLRIVRVDSY